jgi:hypothetical protein
MLRGRFPLNLGFSYRLAAAPARHVRRGKLTDDLNSVGLDCPADRHELEHVEAPLAILVLGDEALGLLEPPGDLSLSEPGRLPGTFEAGEEAFLSGGMDRLAHAPGPG